MSHITRQDLGIDEQLELVKMFSKKLEELSRIEKLLNIKGFEVIIKPIQ